MVSRGGATEIYSGRFTNQQGEPVSQRCTGETTSSQLNVEIDLSCISYLYDSANRSSEIIERFTYSISGTLELEDLLDGETSNLSITKLDDNGITLIPERAIYINPQRFYTVASEANRYLVWVDNEYEVEGLYYSLSDGNKATILKDGNIKTIDISDFNPFTQFPTDSSAYQQARDELSELWELNNQCDISGEYSNVDSQWFENYDSDDSTNHNTVMLADASITVSNCQENYGTRPISGSFNAALSLYHSNSAYRDNGNDSSFSDTEYMRYEFVAGNTQVSASYLIGGGYKLCQSGAPSVYALWYWGQLSGRMFGVNLTLEELELFCSSHQ